MVTFSRAGAKHAGYDPYLLIGAVFYKLHIYFRKCCLVIYGKIDTTFGMG